MWRHLTPTSFQIVTPCLVWVMFPMILFSLIGFYLIFQLRISAWMKRYLRRYFCAEAKCQCCHEFVEWQHIKRLTMPIHFLSIEMLDNYTDFKHKTNSTWRFHKFFNHPVVAVSTTAISKPSLFHLMPLCLQKKEDAVLLHVSFSHL